ncbi:glycosyltransferase family 2 protein [bacterium]|nr:glycosyltransferase family 2 protein [bacterium]
MQTSKIKVFTKIPHQQNDQTHSRSFCPVFSIVIPTYNRAKIISRAIQSILNQTFGEFELIIVDDGSTDDSQKVIKQINDPRICYIRQENRGVAAARNAGVKSSRGKYIAFLDSDDEVLPEWLSHFVNSFTAEKIGVVCVGVKMLNTIEHEETVWLPRNRGPVYDNQTCLFLSGAFAVRREIFDAVGGYVEGLAYGENSELGLRLVSYCTNEKLQIASVAKPLVIYHQQPLRWAKSEEKFKQRLASAEYMLRQHGERYRKKHPRGYTNHCVIAGVNAARLGMQRQARQFFLSAIRVYPWNWRHYGRLLISLIPRVGRAYWLRYQLDSPPFN